MYAVVLVLVSALLFGASTPASKALLDGIHPVQLAGWLYLGAALGPVALLLGLKIASAASVSLWLNLELVATALLGYLLFRDHLGKFGWVAVLGVVLSGVLLSVGEGSAGWKAGLLHRHSHGASSGKRTPDAEGAE
jgi:drug/metabolite transporter (DMT)-like permease